MSVGRGLFPGMPDRRGEFRERVCSTTVEASVRAGGTRYEAALVVEEEEGGGRKAQGGRRVAVGEHR